MPPAFVTSQPDDPGLSLYDRANWFRLRFENATRERDAWIIVAAVGWGLFVLAAAAAVRFA